MFDHGRYQLSKDSAILAFSLIYAWVISTVESSYMSWIYELVWGYNRLGVKSLGGVFWR